MQEKFTIEEIKNYILSKDSLGDVMYNLKAENIIAANSTDLKTWFTDKFNELAGEFGNCETIIDVDIDEGEDNDTTIDFTVDHDDNGIHKHSIKIIQDSLEVRMRLGEILEGGDLERELQIVVENKFNIQRDESDIVICGNCGNENDPKNHKYKMVRCRCCDQYLNDGE